MTAEKIIERANKKSLPMASAYLFKYICHCLPHGETWHKLKARYDEIQIERGIYKQ